MANTCGFYSKTKRKKTVGKKRMLEPHHSMPQPGVTKYGLKWIPLGAPSEYYHKLTQLAGKNSSRYSKTVKLCRPFLLQDKARKCEFFLGCCIVSSRMSQPNVS